MTGRTRALDRVPGLAALADGQLGVVRRDQLAALGVTRDHVRRQVAAQRWRTIGPFVVVLSTGVLTRGQQRSVAVLHAGDGARLAGRTALEQLGLSGWDEPRLHVTVPRGRRPPALPGLVLHTTTIPALGGQDAAEVRAAAGGVRAAGQLSTWPPVVPAARASLDAASWERRREAAIGLVAAVVQQRLATAADVLAELDRLPSLRHGRALRAALSDIADGAESGAELDVARLVQRAGLGIPRRQVRIETPYGTERVDLLVTLPDGRRLVIEVDGPHHDDPRVRARDLARDATLIALGYLVLRIPVTTVRADPAGVLARLRALALGAPHPASA